MLGKRFNIKQIQMPEDMRESVLDQVRKVIDNSGNKTIDQTNVLKTNLQGLFGGEWQVIIAEGQIATYFSKKYIQHFIQLKTQTKTMLIFKRSNSQLPCQKSQYGDSQR